VRLFALTLTVLCCSPGMLLTEQAALGGTNISTSRESQETTPLKPKRRIESTSANSAQPGGSKSSSGAKSRDEPKSGSVLKSQEMVKADNKTSKAVRDFFKQEGEKRFAITDSQNNISILRIDTDPNFPNRRIARVQQFVDGVPVFGARANVLVKQGKDVVRTTGKLSATNAVANIKPIPTIDWLDALERAIVRYRQDFPQSSPYKQCNLGSIEIRTCRIATQLLIFDPARVGLKTGVARLAWMVRLDNVVMFLDANDGSLIFRYSDLQSAATTNRLTYDLNGEGIEGHGVLVLNENGPVDGAQVPHDADMAHRGAAKVHKFFKNLGYDIQDPQVSNVRVEIPDSKAKWHPYGMAYFGPQVPQSVDIVGHEFTHGVLRAIQELDLNDPGPAFGEPGAVNEGFADYFGAVIEGKDNWTIGENLPDGPLRDMGNPHSGGFDPKEPPWKPWGNNSGQPDHYTEKVTAYDDICGYSPWPENENDCPHINSGIFNKATYLASVGGVHHGVDVKGIGKKKLTRVLYAALFQMDPLSEMSTAAKVIVTSCTDLVGQFSISNADCNQVKTAFKAVGLTTP